MQISKTGLFRQAVKLPLPGQLFFFVLFSGPSTALPCIDWERGGGISRPSERNGCCDETLSRFRRLRRVLSGLPVPAALLSAAHARHGGPNGSHRPSGDPWRHRPYRSHRAAGLPRCCGCDRPHRACRCRRCDWPHRACRCRRCDRPHWACRCRRCDWPHWACRRCWPDRSHRACWNDHSGGDGGECHRHGGHCDPVQSSAQQHAGGRTAACVTQRRSALTGAPQAVEKR